MRYPPHQSTSLSWPACPYSAHCSHGTELIPRTTDHPFTKLAGMLKENPPQLAFCLALGQKPWKVLGVIFTGRALMMCLYLKTPSWVSRLVHKLDALLQSCDHGWLHCNCLLPVGLLSGILLLRRWHIAEVRTTSVNDRLDKPHRSLPAGIHRCPGRQVGKSCPSAPCRS